MSERHAIQAILFDTEGVLYHYPRRDQHLTAFLAKYGLTPRHPTVVERALRAARFDVCTGRISREAYQDAVLRMHGLDDPTVFPAGRAALLRDAADLELYPGVWEILIRLQDAGFRLGAISDTPHPVGDLIAWLAMQKASPWLWTAFVVSSDAGATSAEPALFQKALESLGSQPAETAFVGHTPGSLSNAGSLGLLTVAFLPDDPTLPTDFQVRTFYDLADLFQVVS